MEPLQGVVHDAIVEGVREGFGSASAAIFLFSSFRLSGLLPLKLDAEGVLAKYGVEMIGATQEAIDKAEDREKFDIAM